MRLFVEPNNELIFEVTVSVKLVYTRNLRLSLITQFVYPIPLNRLQHLFHTGCLKMCSGDQEMLRIEQFLKQCWRISRSGLGRTELY